MAREYVFRPLKRDEIPAMLNIIRQRIAWMDEVGIRQWNVTDYNGVYPPEYFEGCHARGELFALADSRTDEIVCIGALKQADDRWPDKADALYLHHLAAALAHKGAGRRFLAEAEQYAAGIGMKYLRLDSAVGNQALEDFYVSQGYLPAGRCIDGLYEGILRQKSICL